MAVTLPTVDDFTETTVLTMIRKVVDYLCSDSGLVAQINNNDITGFTSSYTNNILKIDATKGDGTTIPVCNLTIEGGSSTGNPYPTGINGTVGADGNITFTVTMSSGSPLTTTINMNYFASAEDLSDLQEQVTGLKLTSSGNTMSINGTNAPIVNSISGSVSNGNLKITVNGITSADIPLPESGAIDIQCVYSGSYNIVGIVSNANYNYILYCPVQSTGQYNKLVVSYKDVLFKCKSYDTTGLEILATPGRNNPMDVYQFSDLSEPYLTNIRNTTIEFLNQFKTIFMGQSVSFYIVAVNSISSVAGFTQGPGLCTVEIADEITLNNNEMYISRYRNDPITSNGYIMFLLSEV